MANILSALSISRVMHGIIAGSELGYIPAKE
jgi:hypothetical protein